VYYLQTDGNHLVKRSIKLNSPIIIVTINYRLNVLGFLSSRELTAEAQAAGDVVIRNQGLHDQRLALQWIQSHIHHFGGDKSRVTLSGESAGAASVMYHLKTGEALFHQAIIQSTPYPRLRSLNESQTIFDELVRSTGVESFAPAAVKLAALRSLPVDSMIAAANISGPSFPVEDPNWFADYEQSITNAAQYWGSTPPWCSRVIIGHTKDEAALFYLPSIQSLTKLQLTQTLETLFGDDRIVSSLLNTHLFQSAPSPLHALIAYCTRQIFQWPTLSTAVAMSDCGKKVYAYSVDVEDPFPGPLQGFVWHSFGVPLMFYQPSCQKHQQLKITVDMMSDKYIGFMYGKEPWEEIGVAGRKWSWNGQDSGLIDAKSMTDDVLVQLEGEPLRESYLQNSQSLLDHIVHMQFTAQWMLVMQGMHTKKFKCDYVLK
jgi:carboxylesterase type B